VRVICVVVVVVVMMVVGFSDEIMSAFGKNLGSSSRGKTQASG
jgi:preprotein translocase subunit SecG